jgi:ATP/ADP translocase
MTNTKKTKTISIGGLPPPPSLSRSHFIATFLMAVSAGVLLCGYEFARSPSNTLFMKDYGKEAMPFIMGFMPVGVAGILWVYNLILMRVGPRQTLLFTSLGSALILGICHVAVKQGIKLGSAGLFIFREAYAVLLIEQYWSFINSKLTQTEARRWNGPIVGISSLGAIIGSLFVGTTAQELGTGTMLLFAAGACVVAAPISDLAYCIGGAEPHPEKADQRVARKDHLAIGLFRKHPMLIWLLGIILSTQALSTATGLAFNWELFDEFADIDAQTAWSGIFQSWINGLSAVLQFFVVPFLLSSMSVRTVNIAIPVLQISTCAWLFFAPSLWSAAVAHLTFKVFDYSLFRSAKEILYIPFSWDVRYRAKEVIDVFGYRLGKGLTSLSIAVAQNLGVVFTGAIYGAISFGAILTWVACISPAIKRSRLSCESEDQSNRHISPSPSLN